jgi:hypothetical protein
MAHMPQLKTIRGNTVENIVSARQMPLVSEHKVADSLAKQLFPTSQSNHDLDEEIREAQELLDEARDDLVPLLEWGWISGPAADILLEAANILIQS